MRKSCGVLSVLGLTLVLSAFPAFAQDARVEAAKKEGKVLWYTSLALPSAEKVAKLFEAAYPGTKVEVHRTGSQPELEVDEWPSDVGRHDVLAQPVGVKDPPIETLRGSEDVSHRAGQLTVEPFPLGTENGRLSLRSRMPSGSRGRTISFRRRLG